ncbi:hypothetical protein BH10BAC4_BH10BAC4_19910 [soil metagenome]
MYFLILVFFISCQKEKRVNDKTTTIDATKAVKISDYWTLPKESFGLYQSNADHASSGDTLSLATCSEYVYSPFGRLNSKRDLGTSRLGNFLWTDRIEKMDNGEFEFQILKLNSNNLILFFDSTSHVRSTYVFKGEINDSDVVFADNIKIGMTKDDFINAFFDDFPKDQLVRYNTIILEPCVEGTKHVYSFNGNKLSRVEFKSNSYWTVNY